VQRPVDEQIDVLIDLVDALEADGVINGGQANSLRAKLEAAQQSVEKGNTTAAANQLNAFINQVEAFVAAGILTAEEGDALIATAKTILESLA
jgi:ribosomal protein S20